ncbi:MAG: acyl-CoA carboxylase subunit epsilon [Rhodoglobus sp.]
MTENVAAVPDLRVVSTGATDEDVAAVTAVVRGALVEIAAGIELEAGITQTAWQRSQRAIRGTIATGPGVWRGFSG